MSGIIDVFDTGIVDNEFVKIKGNIPVTLNTDLFKRVWCYLMFCFEES